LSEANVPCRAGLQLKGIERDLSGTGATALRADVENLLDIERVIIDFESRFGNGRFSGAAGDDIELIVRKQVDFTFHVRLPLLGERAIRIAWVKDDLGSAAICCRDAGHIANG
jgi:hypothetical protein